MAVIKYNFYEHDCCDSFHRSLKTFSQFSSELDCLIRLGQRRILIRWQEKEPENFGVPAPDPNIIADCNSCKYVGEK